MSNNTHKFTIAELIKNTPDWTAVANLRDCWHEIKAKKKAGGIDRQNIFEYQQRIKQNLKRLNRKLLAKTYVPQPGKRIYIKKSGSEKRPIALLTIDDKIVQKAVHGVIEPLFEPNFLDCSYAYRHNKGHRKAINRLDHYLQQGNHWITTCDIDNFFETLNHRQLLALLAGRVKDEYILNLVKMWIRIGDFHGGEYLERTAGVPQGGVISPLLSNIYMHEFDWAMVKRNAKYLRYADDLIILAKTAQEADGHFHFAAKFLREKLLLNLNPQPKTVWQLSEGFTFLGIYFQKDRKSIAPKKVKKALHKVDRIFGKAINRPFSDVINDLNEAIRAWKYYYGDCDNSDPFQKIQTRIWKKLAYTIYRMNEAGETPERSWLSGNLQRLLLMPEIEASAKKSIHRQVLDGEKNLNLPWGKIQVVHSRKAAATIAKAMPGFSSKKEDKPGDIKRRLAASRQKYVRMFAAAHDLVLSDFGIFVGKRGQRLMIRPKNGKARQFAISKLKHIIVLNQSVTFSTAAIQLCARNDIPIDFLDNFGKPYARIAAPDRPAWRFGMHQLAAQENTKGVRTACAIVEAKIRNQHNLMKYFGKYRLKKDPEFAQRFEKEDQLLQNYLQKVRGLKKYENLSEIRDQLFGYEGQAAAAYWRLIKILVENRVLFEGRIHRGATDEFNALLNYGYGVLYARVWGALMLAGLNPQISFLHKAQYGKPTLVFDLIEPFRAPVIDRVVISMVNRSEKFAVDERGYLSKSSKDKLVKNIFERFNTPVDFRKKRISLQQVLHETAKNLGKFLNNENTNFKPYIMDW